MEYKLAVKDTVEGALIYGTMLAYLLAAVALVLKKKALGWGVYALGFVVALAAYALRWYNVGHVPMQNMFEVFLTLGMVMFPLSLFCRRLTKVGGASADCIMGLIVLFPAGFIFHAEPQKLPPPLQSVLFIPHVAAYMASYMLMAKAAVQACGQLLCKSGPREEGLVSYEQATYKMIRLGFPLLTLGLVLGAIWGKICWGDYWGWDPKELWSLVSWLVYVVYLHFRYVTARRYAWVNSLLALLGLVVIIITLLWANLSDAFKGLHSYS